MEKFHISIFYVISKGFWFESLQGETLTNSSGIFQLGVTQLTKQQPNEI